MRLPLPRLAGAALAATVLSGCESITEPEEQRLVDIALDFCANDTPIWFAYQNQEADWVRVTPDAEGTVAFTATNRVALAFTRVRGSSPLTEVVYAHNLELEELSGRACLEEVGGKQVNGSVTGVSAGQIAQVTMNFASVFLLSTQSAFSLAQLPDRQVDLIASRMNVDGASYAANRVIIRRNINPVNNATLPALDFSVVSTEAFTPTTATLNVTGAAGTSGYVISNFTSQLETSHELAFLDGVPAATMSVTAIPSAQLATGDYHTAIAAVYDSDVSTRGAQRFFHAPGTHALAIPPSATGPSISVLTTSPYPRLRASADRQSAYGGAFIIEYVQDLGLSETAFVVTETRLHAGGSDWRADIPDFSSVAGWQNSWGFHPGDTPIEWTSYMFGGRAALVLGAPPEDGEGLPFATHASGPGAGTPSQARAVSAPRPRLFARGR